jgi:hypothetical protein
VLVGGVVDDQVHHQLHPVLVHGPKQRVEVRQRAERRVDVLVVADVIASVVLRRGIDRRQPDHVHAERGQGVQPAGDPRKITDPVSITVREAARPDLIDHRRLPPRLRRAGVR